MTKLVRMATILCAPLVLLGCLLTPGKFASTLRIDADRSFTFTYRGEVIAVDPGKEMGKGPNSTADADKDDAPAEDRSADDPVLQLADADKGKFTVKSSEDSEGKNRAIAAALSKEHGYRSVIYQGKGKFLIDYAVSGTLTHNFVFPFNVDAEALFPFIVVELRQGGTVRVKAPGFANDNDKTKNPLGTGSPPSLLDGVFMLDTNAEVVSQNNEDGAKSAGGRSVIAWKATPLSKDAPTAVLRLGR
jgi:hypothetical protein